MFRYADYIYEIYKEKSFTKAAKNLFVSQPALSATVRKLEEEMQVHIFDRSTTPLTLTPEGEAYIAAVEQIFRIKKSYENYIIDLSELNTGSVSVSCANFISSFVLPRIIHAFSKKYPMISIDLLESNSKTLVRELVDEKIEILIDYNFDERLIDAHPLFDERILLCVPAELDINKGLLEYAMSADDIKNGRYKNKPVDLSAFANERFLMMKEGNSMNYHSFKLCADAGFYPNVKIFFDQLMTTYNMTCAGVGICFVTDTLVRSVASSDDLFYYRLDGEYAKRTVYLLRKKTRYLNKAAREFIRIATEVYTTDDRNADG